MERARSRPGSSPLGLLVVTHVIWVTTDDRIEIEIEEAGVPEQNDWDEQNDWNAKVIAEFRANDGRVGGNFEGAPVLLLHHQGRKSGRTYVSPMMYLADDDDPAKVYVFASKAGDPSHPDWYFNLTNSGEAKVELGTETYDVHVSEVTGDDRDRIYAEQARQYPGFADYERKTEGVRTIPVLALRRA